MKKLTKKQLKAGEKLIRGELGDILVKSKPTAIKTSNHYKLSSESQCLGRTICECEGKPDALKEIEKLKEKLVYAEIDIDEYTDRIIAQTREAVVESLIKHFESCKDFTMTIPEIVADIKVIQSLKENNE